MNNIVSQFKYNSIQTKAFELVNGKFKKSHKGTYGPVFDINEPKCTNCREEVTIIKEGKARSGSEFVTHYCSKCEIYYNTFFKHNKISDNVFDENIDFEQEDDRIDFGGNPWDFGDQ